MSDQADCLITAVTSGIGARLATGNFWLCAQAGKP
jgi:hypothetical protein